MVEYICVTINLPHITFPSITRNTIVFNKKEKEKEKKA
jgi:hypothetical protein